MQPRRRRERVEAFFLADSFVFEILAGDELADHLQRGLWLVHGHHVARVLDHQERQQAETLRVACERAASGPGRVHGAVEVARAAPIQIVQRPFQTDVVTDEVVLAVVKQSADLLAVEEVLQTGHDAQAVLVPQSVVGRIRALAEARRLRVDVERGAHARQVHERLEPVVAGRVRHRTPSGFARVVHVHLEAAVVFRRDAHDLIQQVPALPAHELQLCELGLAGLFRGLNFSSLHRVDEAQCLRETRNVVLVEGVDPGVAEREALDVEIWRAGRCQRDAVGPCDEALDHQRHVVARMRLAREEDGHCVRRIAHDQSGVRQREARQKRFELRRNARIVAAVRVRARVREARAHGLVDVQHMRRFVPRRRACIELRGRPRL
mmetsp:Transcript_15824/g.53313  ORF Transcript_15824/g.53313 Transcript_15824/m.53313 type:complete len:379 (-) Transcript_15824:534-1670(-)